MKAPVALQRGMACLCCRKRKMKCDGARPVCSQCSKARRAADCQYYEKKRTSRTQLLQAKITKLEARLRELEAEQSLSDSPVASSSTSQSPLSVSIQPPNDPSPSAFEASDFGSTPELDHEYFLNSTDTPFPSFEEDSINPPHLSGMPWSGDALDFPSAVNDFLAPSPSNSSVNSLHDPSSGHCTNWWENDVFCENKQMLLDIFLSHRHQCAFDVHVGRLKTSLLMPTTKQPHPSLVDAILLLSCFLSRSPSLTALEPYFLKRCLRGITDALQHSDRVVQVLQASCLLSTYFFWYGRTLEGYYHSSIAARLAVGLGLHQIRPKEWFQFQYARAGYQPDAPAPLKASVPLSPPHDEVEYAERVAAWWQIFIVDRAWSVATGLPTALPDDDHPRSRIETIWPVPIPDDPDPAMDSNLIQPFPGSHLSGSSATAALRAKAIVLFERTARFSASSSTTKDESHYSLDMSISQFSTNLSNITTHQYSVPYSVSTVDIASLHTVLYAATIHVHRGALEAQKHSYHKCVWAANAITAQIRGLTDADYQLLCPIIGTCWRTAADVYLRMLATSQGPSPPVAVELIEQQIDTLITALQNHSRYFPVAGVYAAKIQEERAAGGQAYASVGV